MANNQIKRGKAIPPLLLLVLMNTLCSNSFAQNISKYYRVSMQENGRLFFVEPEQKFKNKNTHCKLSYDLTYLTSKDTVLLNFTYTDNTIRLIDSIRFVYGENRISSITKKLFIENDKKLWKHRYSAKFSFDEIYLIYHQEKSPKILLYFGNKSTQLGIKNRKWKKKSKILSKIMTLIKVNKK